ncbi:MAG: NAD(P)-binding protein [Ilumatobacteraceae bacterium]
MTKSVTVAGGGLGGLVAAIELAEQGWEVELHERSAELGGNASTDPGPYRTNMGPHAFYTNNPLFGWMERRGLLPPLVIPGAADLWGFRVIDRGVRRHLLRLVPGLARRLRSAPETGTDLSYREWTRSVHGGVWAERLVGLASLPTFHEDPGRLSASTVHSAMRAAWVEGRVRYVRGGFGTLVEVLAARARDLGVAVHVASPVDALPDGPCILAVDLDAARRLTGDDGLRWPGDPLALLDVAVTASRRDGLALLDLDEHVWANVYSSGDPTLTPTGTRLLQAHAGMRDGEDLAGAVGRIETHLDDHLPGWRERERWRRRRVMRSGATPADPPGTTWHDRPAVRRADGLYVVNDRMAQPGLLSSVSVAAARAAVTDLTGARSGSAGGGTVATSTV